MLLLAPDPGWEEEAGFPTDDGTKCLGARITTPFTHPECIWQLGFANQPPVTLGGSGATGHRVLSAQRLVHLPPGLNQLPPFPLWRFLFPALHFPLDDKPCCFPIATMCFSKPGLIYGQTDMKKHI